MRALPIGAKGPGLRDDDPYVGRGNGVLKLSRIRKSLTHGRWHRTPLALQKRIRAGKAHGTVIMSIAEFLGRSAAPYSEPDADDQSRAAVGRNCIAACHRR